MCDSSPSAWQKDRSKKRGKSRVDEDEEGGGIVTQLVSEEAVCEIQVRQEQAAARVRQALGNAVEGAQCVRFKSFGLAEA